MNKRDVVNLQDDITAYLSEAKGRPEAAMLRSALSAIKSLSDRNDSLRSKLDELRSFTPPTKEEVFAEFEKKGRPELASGFYLHFGSNGWMVGGKSKMRSLPLAVANWIQRDEQYGRQRKTRNGANGSGTIRGNALTAEHVRESSRKAERILNSFEQRNGRH